jgi:hypothetical protein
LDTQKVVRDGQQQVISAMQGGIQQWRRGLAAGLWF